MIEPIPNSFRITLAAQIILMLGMAICWHSFIATFVAGFNVGLWVAAEVIKRSVIEP